MSNYQYIHSTLIPWKPIRWLVIASILSIVYYMLSTALLHFVDPSVDPLTHGISYYAVGPYRYLMTSAFIILGLGGMALAASLYLVVPGEARSVAGLVLLAVWGATTILAGIFPLDAEGATQTTSGIIHNYAGMNFLAIAMAAFLISRRLRSDRRWQYAAQTAMWLALAVILASVLLFVLMGLLHSLGIGGIAQRVYWLTALAWLFFVALRLRETGLNQPSPIGD